MGNQRTKLARSGCIEVSVNTGKRSRNNPDKESPHCNMKRARRAEVNYLPDFPCGVNQTRLEQMRLQIVQEVAKSEKSKVLTEKLMQTTFALRRREIIQDIPQVTDILERWPALQVCAEFHRITNVNLRSQCCGKLAAPCCHPDSPVQLEGGDKGAHALPARGVVEKSVILAVWCRTC